MVRGRRQAINVKLYRMALESERQTLSRIIDQLADSVVVLPPSENQL